MWILILQTQILIEGVTKRNSGLLSVSGRFQSCTTLALQDNWTQYFVLIHSAKKNLYKIGFASIFNSLRLFLWDHSPDKLPHVAKLCLMALQTPNQQWHFFHDLIKPHKTLPHFWVCSPLFLWGALTAAWWCQSYLLSPARLCTFAHVTIFSYFRCFFSISCIPGYA